jgi:nucleoside 2-deoxyribosyltransferase
MKIYVAGPLFTSYEQAFISKVAKACRDAGIECFVPHENFSAADGPITAEKCFRKDFGGISNADAVLAVLDGCMVDDGTACEIGIMYGLCKADPNKKGIVGLMTDSRGMRTKRETGGLGLNLFVRGCIEEVGEIVLTIEDAVNALKRLESK